MEADLDRVVALACRVLSVPVAELAVSLSRRDGGGWVASVRRSSDSESLAIQAYGYASAALAVSRLAEGLREDC